MKTFDFTIRTRLYAGFGALVALLILLVCLAFNSFTQLATAGELNIRTYQMLGDVDAALMSLLNIETGARGFALTGAEASLEPYNQGKQTFLSHLESAGKLAAENPDQQERMRLLLVEAGRWRDTAIEPGIALRRATDDAGISAIVAFERQGKGKQSMDKMRKLLSDIKGEEMALLAGRATAVADSAARLAWTLVAGGVSAILLGTGLAIWLGRNITGPLAYAVNVAKRVAKGDLTTRIEVRSSDETGQLLTALKDMNGSLSDIVTRVRVGTDTITLASREINAGNQDLSSRTEQQASSLEETASSLEELTSTVKQNADHARRASDLAGAASETAARGGAVVAKVVDTMGAINASSRKISDIISVIDGIAFQTNILALNASVEAARAGEQGRGFAVVAGEVRTLAQRSAAAAKEINALISDSVATVEAGSRLVDQAGRTMDEVVSSVRGVTGIVGEIAVACEEQHAGIEQVNQAISQMDQVTQQNATLVEQAAAAADSMNQQANELAALVSTFQTQGKAAAASASQPTSSISTHPSGKLVTISS